MSIRAEPACTVYVVVAHYGTDAERLAAVRPAHHAYARSLRQDGHLLLAGPFADGTGALFVYRAESPAKVAAWIAADPFQQAGVFAGTEVRPWSIVTADHGALAEVLAHLGDANDATA